MKKLAVTALLLLLSFNTYAAPYKFSVGGTVNAMDPEINNTILVGSSQIWGAIAKGKNKLVVTYTHIGGSGGAYSPILKSNLGAKFTHNFDGLLFGARVNSLGMGMAGVGMERTATIAGKAVKLSAMVWYGGKQSTGKPYYNSSTIEWEGRATIPFNKKLSGVIGYRSQVTNKATVYDGGFIGLEYNF